jgi:FKBP-type peptidyl-prolyl cis-trans isomerase
MKVGEIADFHIQYDYAYGEQGSPPSIPARAALNLFSFFFFFFFFVYFEFR